MTRSAQLWFAAGVALAGFAAGTALHPLAFPTGWHLRSLTASGGRADAGAAAARDFRRCDGLGWQEKRECYEADLAPIAASRGPKFALAVLTQLTTLDEQVRVAAHSYAHAIGVAAYDAHHDLVRTFPDCDVIYQSGCYHGVIQAYFMHSGSSDSATVRAACAPWAQENVYGWLRFQCSHGLGHGLTMLVDHDLPEALLKCDYLTDDWDRDSCYGGAFMENIVDTTQPKHDMGMSHAMVMHDMARPKFKQLDKTNVAYPCSILAERYQTSCWTNQASIIEYIVGYDPARTAKGCDLAPARYIHWCYIGLGTDFNGRVLSDAKAGIALCDRTGTQYREWCYVGAAKNLVEDGAKPSAGMAFCRLVTQANWKMRCYEAVGEEIASVSGVPADREKMCLEAEEPYRPGCRFGARILATRPPGLPSPD